MMVVDPTLSGFTFVFCICFPPRTALCGEERRGEIPTGTAHTSPISNVPQTHLQADRFGTGKKALMGGTRGARRLVVKFP